MVQAPDALKVFAKRRSRACDRSRVLIVERNPTGHRLMYVALLARAAVGQGSQVTLALSRECLRSGEFVTHLEPIREHVDVLEASFDSLSSMTRSAAALGARRVVVPDGDAFIGQAVMKHRAGAQDICVTLLCMRSQSRSDLRAGLRLGAKNAVKRLARHRSGVEVFDLVSSATRTPGRWQVPDPVSLTAGPDDVERFRRAHRIGTDRFWFSVIGAITPRKNPELVISALEGLGTPNVGLLLVGRLAPELEAGVRAGVERLLALGIEVRRIPGPLDEQDFDAAVSASDCCVLAHDNEGPSGIFGKATAAGRRIVAAGAESLRLDCEMSSATTIWCRLDRQRLTEAMRRIMTADDRQDHDSYRAAPTTSFTDPLLGSRRPTRIVQVLLSSRVGGAEAVADTLEQEWDRLGVGSQIVHVDTLTTGRMRRLTRIVRLAGVIREMGAEAIVSHSAIPNAYARLVKPRGVPVATVLHSASDDYSSPRLRRAEHVLRRRTAHVVAVSSTQAEQYRGYFGASVPISVIPNGIADGYAVSLNPPSPEPRSVVTVARVARQKNPRLWLEVAQHLLQKHPNLTFTWYGPVADDPQIQDLVARAKDIPGVSFAGPSAQIPRLLAGSDIVFHPSDREAHSIAVLEAGASGVPLVCAQGIDGPIDQSFAAAHFAPGDAQDAAEALLRVIDDFPRTAQRARNLAPSVQTAASGSTMARKYLDLLAVHPHDRPGT